MSEKRVGDLSMSMPPAKNRTKKIRPAPVKPDESLTGHDPERVRSTPSLSPFANLFSDPRFQKEWANQVRFHVARNLLYLRRYRKMSQATLANKAGTSQSAIARIESAQENITLDTLERIVVALDGSFFVSIPPHKLALRHSPPWWEFDANGSGWFVTRVMARRGTGMDQMIIGVERPHEHSLSASTTPSIGELLVAANTN